MTRRTEDESPLPQAVVFPPLLFVGLSLLGLALQLVRPWSLHLSLVPRCLGGAMVCGGIGLAVWARMSLTAAGTTIDPRGASTVLVQAGPYRYTRNPMYLSMAMAMLGLAGAASTGWVALLWPLAVVTADIGIIRREEKRLTRWFGEPYLQYCRRVRRWL